VPPGIELTFRVADLPPTVDGLNVTTTVHPLPADSAPKHVVDPATTRKSPGFAPPRDTINCAAGRPPVLDTVNVWLALTPPMGVLGNAATGLGLITSFAGITHTPLFPSQNSPPLHASPAAQVRHCPGVALHWVL
jgi:hypothetical protein